MTPRGIDRDIVAQRLRLMDAALADLASIGPVDAARLSAEPLTRAAAERLLQVVVDLAFDINGHLAVALVGRAPETGRQSFLDLAEADVLSQELAERMAPSAGLRNVLVHGYVDIRLDIAAAVGQVLDQYPVYVRTVSSRLTEPSDGA